MSTTPPLFVYGTLRDPEIRVGVIGRAPAPGAIRPATLPGWKTVYYPGELYPALIPGPAASAEGLVLSGLDDAEMARLDAFEGGQYRRAPVAVTIPDGTLAAQAYFPTIAIAPQSPAWSFEIWYAAHRPHVIARYRADGFA